MGLMEDMGLDVPLPESWAQASVRRKLGLAHGPTKLISSLVSRSARMTTPWGSAFILDERGFRNTTRCGPPYSFDGEGLVVGAVNDQGRHVECRQIGAEVGGRERFCAFQHGFRLACIAVFRAQSSSGSLTGCETRFTPKKSLKKPANWCDVPSLLGRSCRTTSDRCRQGCLPSSACTAQPTSISPAICPWQQL